MKIRPVGTKLFHSEQRTDRWKYMTKLMVAFRILRSFLKRPKLYPLHITDALQVSFGVLILSLKAHITMCRIW